MNSRSITTLVILLSLVFAVSANAQYYFGQNKIQYTDFDWQVLTTEHYNVYFYPEEKDIAEAAAYLAEESYTFLQEKFNHTIENRVPIIIYSSPVFFEQTNVIPGILPENVAGFTEYFKQRVVVPFNGSYADFAHVVRHELVHVFTMQKLAYVTKMHRKNNVATPPLWFMEGIAEYWSIGWDSQADMFMRDMTISGRIISINNMGSISGTFLMYKVGQSIMKYLGETYGDDKITDLFDNWWKGKHFSDNIRITFGKTLTEIGKEWEYYLKKNYYPYIEYQELPDRVGKKLTHDGYNLKPTIFLKDTKDGREEYIAFQTYRLGYSMIAEMPFEGEKKRCNTLIKAGRSEQFESLHITDSGLDANDDGLIAFASKTQETDALYIYDTKRGKVIKKIKNKKLVSISSPSWAPDRRHIVFEGVAKAGISDLYLVDIETDEFRQLTNDIYLDMTPSFSYTDSLLAFSSDRQAYGDKGSRNLFLYNLETGEITRLTSGNHIDESPSWTRTGDRLIFTSDRNGSMNLYVLNDVTNGSRSIMQLTDIVTGIFDPVVANYDSTIVFSAYQNFGFHIYKMDFPDSAIVRLDEPDYTTKHWHLADSWSFPKLTGETTKGSAKYKTQLSFDIAQSTVAYDAVIGTLGGLQFALTDILGNHQWYFLLFNTANTKGSFLKSMNFASTYLNKTRRINYGAGIFHFYNEYSDDYYSFVDERTYGGLLTASYPISRYRRIESALYVRKIEKKTTLFDDTNATTSTLTLSYIKDTSIWDPTGPIDGTRINIGTAQSINMKGLKYFNSTYNVDFRKYFRLGAASAYATRLMYLHSVGEDPQRYYLGGSWSLRGYPRRSFYGRNLLLINNELRFPLVDNLIIGFPFGALRFQAIRGAMFFDAGNAWEDDYRDLVGSFGFGFRVALGYVTVLRFDFARKTDFRNVSNTYDFDFFFGWNF